MTTNHILIPMEISQFWKELKSVVEQAVLQQIPQQLPAKVTIDGFPTLLKAKEVCSMFGISKPTLYEWMRNGKIPSVKIGARRFFDASDLEAIIKDNRVEARAMPVKS
jgi:excisionase family DNA binding protein